MSTQICGDCLIPLSQCAHAVEYITQRRAIKKLKQVNSLMEEMFNLQEEEDNERNRQNV